jgi:hypothetical protein
MPHAKPIGPPPIIKTSYLLIGAKLKEKCLATVTTTGAACTAIKKNCCCFAKHFDEFEKDGE